LVGTGFSAQRFVDAVQTFYEEHNRKARIEQDNGQDSNLLFSDAPPVEQIVVDDAFLEGALAELRNNPDIRVRQTPRGENVASEQGENGLLLFPKFRASLAGKSLFVSEERLWLEVTGHSVDHTRIPAREFDCLVVIAAAGPDGLLQKHVVERTGQDKRSVPKRTDRLAQNGYIIKEPVVGEGARTSNLKLKKFLQIPAVPGQDDGSRTAEQPSDGRSIIFYDAWFDATMKMLQDNDNIASMSDLRAGLNIDGKSWETRRYFHCLRRLISAGCLRSLSAAVSGGANDEKSKRKQNMHRSHCLQLLREPTAADRKAFQTGTYKNNRQTIVPDDEEPDDGEELEQSDSGDFHITADAEETTESNKPIAAPIARWTPSVSLYIQIFDLVDNAGPRGLTAKQLYEPLGGASFHRPIDDALNRLTDIWQHSQPPHLRRLTLVRDTVIDNKALVYNFRSLENYGKAVAAGQAVWDAVIKDDARAEFEKAGNAEEQLLDQWGFPLLDKRQFVRGGRASLTECGLGSRSRNARFPARQRDKQSARDEEFENIVSDSDLPQDPQPISHSAARKTAPDLATSTKSTEATSPSQKGSTAGAKDAPSEHIPRSAVPANRPIVNDSIAADVESQEHTTLRDNGADQHKRDDIRQRDISDADDSTRPRKRQRVAQDGGADDADAASASRSQSITLPAETDAARRLREFFENRPKGRPTRTFLEEAEKLRNLVAEEENQRQALEAREQVEPHLHDATGKTLEAGANVDDAAVQSTLEDEVDDDDPTQTRSTRPSRVKRTGLLRSGGFVAAQREKIILDAVHACGGVFPGNNEMWYVLATAWQKLSSQTPDRQTLDRAIRNIIASNKLQKFTWTFSDKKGFVNTRAILAEPHIKLQDPVVKAVQRKVEETFPNQYLPEEVEVFSSLRHQAASAPGTGKPAAVSYAKDSHAAKPNTHDHGLRNVMKRNGAVSGRVKFPPDHTIVVQAMPDVRMPLADIPANDQVDAATEKPPATQPEQRAISSSTLKTNVNKATAGSVIGPVMNGSIASIAKDTINDTASLAARFQKSQRQYQRLPSGLKVLPVPVKRAYRRRHDINTLHPLGEGGEQRQQARSLFMGLPCVLHAATWTFASRAIISETSVIPHRVGIQPVFVKPPSPPSKTLRNVVDEIQLSRKTRRTKLLPYESQDAFYREIRNVQTWEEQMIAADQPLRGEEGVTFINHTLKVPHVVLKRASQKKRPEGVPLVSTAREPSPKKKYRSRIATIAPTVEVEEEEPRPVLGRAKGDARKRRDRRGAASFADGERLIAAIALIMVVAGGINQDRLSWTLISHALSFRYDGEFLRRRWNFYRRGRQGDLDALRDAIREPFLVAYENDKIPKVDYQDIGATDWPALLEWVEDEVMPTVRDRANVDNKVTTLPVGNVPNQAFHEALGGPLGAGTRKNDYFENPVVDHRKQMVLHHFNGIILPSESTTNRNQEDNVLLKSWIRAVALTREFTYDADAASARLSVFDASALSQVTQEMVDSQLLIQDRKGRHLPGRNFQVHQNVLSQFSRWSRQDEHLYLRDAADARSAIDAHFETNDSLELVTTAQDVEYLVLTNMVAQGFITPKIGLPERNDDPAAPHPKLTKWSYGGNNYEMKNVKISDLKFPIFYQKTDNYTSDHGLQSAPIPSYPNTIFPNEPDYRHPIWTDIHGNRLHDVWDMAVRSILHVIVYRSGYTATMIEAAHNSKLWTWEIDLVLSWMEAAGIAEHCGAEEEEANFDPLTGAWRGGWRASAWWYCAFLPEIADWPVPGGSFAEQIGGWFPS
jgi:hypothetical protein